MVIFFQAEDGIRDIGVTGVQTCASSDLRRSGRATRCCTATRRSTSTKDVSSSEPARHGARGARVRVHMTRTHGLVLALSLALALAVAAPAAADPPANTLAATNLITGETS